MTTVKLPSNLQVLGYAAVLMAALAGLVTLLRWYL